MAVFGARQFGWQHGALGVLLVGFFPGWGALLYLLRQRGRVSAEGSVATPR